MGREGPCSDRPRGEPGDKSFASRRVKGRASGDFARAGGLIATAAFGATDEDFSVVVLPDTQIYAWICGASSRPDEVDCREQGEVQHQYVLHVGDVVEHNNEKEWKIAREALSLLDGKVPYAIALGNHDIGPRGSSKTRDTLFGEYFPLTEFKKWESFGGVYDREPDRGENIYHVFRAGGRQWLALVLEFGPRVTMSCVGRARWWPGTRSARSF